MFALATTVELMAAVCLSVIRWRRPHPRMPARGRGTAELQAQGIAWGRAIAGGGGSDMAKSAVIAPLTGIRLVAAVWVVCFHIYLYDGHRLAADHPWVDAVVGPIASQGDLGVDLFFLLSGFVLAHNYLERLGAEPSLRGTLSFLWLRVARIWPLYMVAICGGGLLLWLRLHLWGSQPNVPLSWHHFLAQVF